MFDDTNVTINTATDHAIVVDLEYLQKLPKLLAETPFTTIGTTTITASYRFASITSDRIIVETCCSAIRVVECLFDGRPVDVATIS